MVTDSRLDEIADRLVEVDGIEAVVLGGSRARGAHRPDSDVDLGLYYSAELNVVALQRLADELADRRVDMAGPGSWGPWVDGGGWLQLDGMAVDWILRSVDRVDEQCRRAVAGECSFGFQIGHPLGFLDVAYAGEVALCRVLADPSGLVAGWKESVTPYPPKLREAMLAGLWEVDFMLGGTVKSAKGGDVAHVALCLSRVAMVAAHAWHAQAGSWVINEKGLVGSVAGLDLDSRGFVDHVTGVLSGLGTTPAELLAAVELMRAMPVPRSDR